MQATSTYTGSNADNLMRALLLVRSYEMRGHNIAKVNPKPLPFPTSLSLLSAATTLKTQNPFHSCNAIKG